MNGPRRRRAFPLVLAVLTLRCRSPLLLDFEQGPIGMRASGDAVSLDARRARKLLFVDQDHVAQGVDTRERLMVTK